MTSTDLEGKLDHRALNSARATVAFKFEFANFMLRVMHAQRTNSKRDAILIESDGGADHFLYSYRGRDKL